MTTTFVIATGTNEKKTKSQPQNDPFWRNTTMVPRMELKRTNPLSVGIFKIHLNLQTVNTGTAQMMVGLAVACWLVLEGAAL